MCTCLGHGGTPTRPRTCTRRRNGSPSRPPTACWSASLARAADALEQGKEELHTALAEMENALAGALPDDTGTVRLDGDDHLVIPKLTAEDIPAEARELKEELPGMLPFAPIASLLIELDGRTELPGLLHPRGRPQARPLPGAEAQHPGRTHRSGNEPGPGQDVGGVRDLLRRARVDDGVVHARGDAARGQHGRCEPPLRAGAVQGVRRRHHVLLRRAALPGSRQVADRPGHGHPRRPGAVDLYPRVRPVVHLRHQDHRTDGEGGPLRAVHQTGQQRFALAETAFVSLAQPGVAEGMERCRSLGARRIVVARYRSGYLCANWSAKGSR